MLGSRARGGGDFWIVVNIEEIRDSQTDSGHVGVPVLRTDPSNVTEPLRPEHSDDPAMQLYQRYPRVGVNDQLAAMGYKPAPPPAHEFGSTAPVSLGYKECWFLDLNERYAVSIGRDTIAHEVPLALTKGQLTNARLLKLMGIVKWRF